MKPRSILAAAAFGLAASASPAVMASGVALAFCGVDGCTCAVSAVTADELISAAGYDTAGDAPIDRTSATLVVDHEHRVIFWSDASREAIDRSYGGNGECPIELFPDDPLIPRDGLWRWNTVSTAVRGCPPMLAGMFANTGALDLAHSERVTWNGQFNPARFAGNADMSAYQWVDRGNHSWTTVPIADSGCSDGACQSVSIQLWMTLVSETKTRGHLTYDMEISGAGAEARQVLAATGMGACNVVVRYEIDRIAD